MFIGLKFTQIELENIFLVDCESRRAAVKIIKEFSQISVQFHAIQFGIGSDQVFSQRSLAGTYFQQMVSSLRPYGLNNSLDDASIVEEVLAEVLSRPVFHAVIREPTGGVFYLARTHKPFLV